MEKKLSEIHHKIHLFIEREKRKEGLLRLLKFCFILFASVFLFTLLENFLNLSVTQRTFLFYSYLIVLISFSVFYIGFNFIKDFIYYIKPDYINTAKKIGDKFPNIKDEFVNILQIVDNFSVSNSQDLTKAAFENFYLKIKDLDFTSIVDFSIVKKFFKIVLLEFLILSIIIISIPSLQNAFYRLINFNKDFSPPKEFYFSIIPGNKIITKGESVNVKIFMIGKKQDEVTFYYKNEDEPEFTFKKLNVNNENYASYNFLSLNNSIQYFAKAKNIQSEIYKIDVYNRPIINLIDLEIIPPAYTKMKSTFQRDNGNITVLKGSKVKFTLTASRELSKSEIVFGDSTKKNMNVRNNKAYFEMNVFNNFQYHFEIYDKSNIKNENAIQYSINIENDLSPSIELISPKTDIKLGTENKIPLGFNISDDFGFTKLTLNYNLISSKYRKPFENYKTILLLVNKEKIEEEIFYVWDLSPLVLAEGETLSYYLEIYDNDLISGPKSSRTNELRIIVPSLNEIFETVQNEQQNSIEDLQKSLKEAEKLQNELQKLSDELKQNKSEISWQEKEKIEKAAEKFHQLGEKLNEISKNISDIKKELLKNNLLSEETLSKYNELQKLLEEFNSDELKNAFKKMQDALKSLARDNVQMSLEELKANEDYIKNSIERTLNLLKRIQVEQKVDELIKRTENITEELKNISEKTEKENLNNRETQNEISKKQKNISDKINQLKKSLSDLQNKMHDLKDLPQDLVDKINSEFDNQNNEELSDEILKQISQLQKMNALQNQKRLLTNMQLMKKQFENLQSQIQQANQMRSFIEMAKILDDLIKISKEQEKLRKQTETSSQTINELNKNLKSQNLLISNLLKTLDKMSNLSQKTFAITPEMGKAIGKALNEMKQSQISIQNQNLTLSNNYQRNAMQYVNEAATLLKGSMNQMMNGGQGGGMMSLMQQLQQMSQQQMNINQLTQMLNQGQINQETLAQMQRLAQQQELIRKSLEQLNNEAKSTGESKKLASNLENILNEMKEVVSNLQSNKIDDNLIKQQERILSKLLDAQRSINERDFDETRKSSSGENISKTSPKELILNEKNKNKLKEELQKALREGFKKDYEELIRKYFESLEKIYSK